MLIQSGLSNRLENFFKFVFVPNQKLFSTLPPISDRTPNNVYNKLQGRKVHSLMLWPEICYKSN